MADFPPKAYEQARRIAALMRHHRQRFEDEVSKWDVDATKQLEEEKEFHRRLNKHLKKALNDSRLRNKETGPPGEGWEWQVNPLSDPQSTAQHRLVGAWVPPGLVKPPDSRLPIIVTDRSLTLREKFAVLAAIHDVIVEKKSDTEREGRYPVLMAMVLERKDEFWDEAALWIDDVEHVLPPSPPRAEVKEDSFPGVSDMVRIHDVPCTAQVGTSPESAGSETPPPADPSGAPDDTSEPTLTKDDLAILRAIENGPTTMLQEEIADAADVSRRTVSNRLKHLRDQGLVDRPRGERQGEAITEKGRELLKRLSPGST